MNAVQIAHWKTKVFRAWDAMIQRCTNPKCEAFKNYGGRGITVCNAWMTFAAFKQWADANGHADDLELDRIDNSAGYCPENCRFVSHSENNRNKRTNHNVTAFGETKCVTEWTEDSRCSIAYNTLIWRLNTGWSIEEAITTPPNVQNKRHLIITAFGESKRLSHWGRDPRCKVSALILNKRLKRGWDPETAISTPPQPLGTNQYNTVREPVHAN